MIYIGIDPGKSGSISVVWPDGQAANSHARGDWTEHEQADWLQQFDLSEAIAVIEKVSATPQMGVTSSFTFGRSYGFLRGVLAALKVRTHDVSPQKWQTAMGCKTGGDKNVSKAAAQQRWPHVKITHRNADSLLLAEYGRLHVPV